MSKSGDCVAPEHTFLKYLDMRNLEYEPVSATSLRIGDKAQAAEGQIATIIRKEKRDNRSVLGIGTVNSRMRSTSQKIKGEINGQHMEFEALEKVDGSNFSFSTDGSTIDYFRRNDRLDKDANVIRRTPASSAMQPFEEMVIRASQLQSPMTRGHNIWWSVQ